MKIPENQTKPLPLSLASLFVVFTIVTFLGPDRTYGAYKPPVGILNPLASWGGTQNPTDDLPPAPPNPWSSEVPGYYYVDNDTGTDTGRPYGKPSAPRSTIPNPIPAGSYVEVHGTYDHLTGGDVRINGQGTNAGWQAGTAGPVWVVGITGDRPYFTGGKTLIYGSYVYLFNTTHGGITSGNVIQISSTSVGFPADHIAIRSADVAGTSTSGYGLNIVANSGSPVNHILIKDSIVHDHGPTNDVDQDSHMINVGSYINNVWILANTLQNSSGSGIQLGAGAPGPQYVYIGRNTVDNSRQSGIWVKYASDVMVSENTVHDVQDRCVGVDTSPSKGLGAQYSPVRVWWIFNTVYNVRYGLRVASTDGSNTIGEYYVVGNIFRNVDIAPASCFPDPTGTDSWAMAAIHLHGGTTRYIVGNTISKVKSGIHISRSASAETYVEDNIIDTISHSNGYYLFAEQTTNLTIRNNLVNSTAGQAIRWGTSDYPTLSAWRLANPAEGEDCLELDPGFINASSNDLHLQSTSPAINRGIASNLYQVDFDGNARPQGGAWDIGAYEKPSLLPAPKNLNVQ